MINEEHVRKLAKFDISVKSEAANYSILQLKNNSYLSKISYPLYMSLLSAIDSYNHAQVQLPSNMTFGVELEFVGDSDISCQALCEFNVAMTRLLKEKYMYAGKYVHNDGNYWILGKDSSIKYDPTCELGYELSSAKLNLFNDHDFSTLKTVISYIERYFHGRVNDSCGTHIHLGFKYDNLYRSDISHSLYEYSTLEEIGLDPLVPTNRRRNTYCKPTRPFLYEKYQKLSARYCDFNEFTCLCDSIRFESRQLDGTLDFKTISYWLALQSHIIYDIVSNRWDKKYIKELTSSDAFHLLFRYDFDSDLINFFIDRILRFKSRKLSAHCKLCI